MYDMHPATLGDIEGEGYAFQRKTFQGKTTQGVFFPFDDAKVEDFDKEQEVAYEGHLYLMTTDRPTEEEVAITNVVSTRAGLRVTFEAVDNPGRSEDD